MDLTFLELLGGYALFCVGCVCFFGWLATKAPVNEG